MRQMTTEKLFDDGKYMVIYLSPESVKLDERMFFLWTKEDQHTMTRANEKDTNSCEDMVAYPDKLLVSKIDQRRIVRTEEHKNCLFFRLGSL